MRVKANIVPNAFTMANLFCGFFSVILASNGKFVQASWLIVAAAALDALDGKVARFAKVSSQFGVEYDSLADVVSFGFAPSFLAYQVVFQNWGTLGMFISFLPLVFGSVRLARFNIKLKGFNKDYFEGLPIPSAAVTIVTFVVFNYHFWDQLRWEKVFLFIFIAVSILMVSTIRYETFPDFSLHKGSANRRKFLVFLVGVATIVFFPQEAFFTWAVIYATSGPARYSWQMIRGIDKDKKKNEEALNESSN
jgi:CDP-diacylglycerol--serine O-phosphatidyltransferase